GGQVQGLPDLPDLGGPVEVVEQGGHPLETDGAEELFVVQPPLGPFELGVPLWRYLSQAMVYRHLVLFFGVHSQGRWAQVFNAGSPGVPVPVLWPRTGP